MEVNKLTGNIKPLDVVDKTNECIDELNSHQIQINEKVPSNGAILTNHYEKAQVVSNNDININLGSSNALHIDLTGTTNITFSTTNYEHHKVFLITLNAHTVASTINWQTDNVIWTDASRPTYLAVGGRITVVGLFANGVIHLSTLSIL